MNDLHERYHERAEKGNEKKREKKKALQLPQHKVVSLSCFHFNPTPPTEFFCFFKPLLSFLTLFYVIHFRICAAFFSSFFLIFIHYNCLLTYVWI